MSKTREAPRRGDRVGSRTTSRRVAVNSALQAGADAFGKLGMLVLYAVMAREAGQAAFGDFTSAASLAVLVMIAAFGMDYRVTRLVAREEAGAGEAYWSALLLKVVLGTIALAAVLGVAIFGPYEARVVVATALLGAAMVVELAMLTPQAVFRGMEQLQPVATALILYRGALTIVGVTLLVAGASVVAVAGAWLGSAVLAAAYTARRMRVSQLHLPRRITRASLWAVGVDSFGLGLAAVFGAAISRLDIVILGFLKDSESVALYGAAYRLVESTQFLTAAIALSSFPALTRLTRASSPTIGEATALATKVVLIVMAPIAGVFALYSEPLLGAIFGSSFREAGTTLELLAPVVVLAGLCSLVAFILTAQQRQWPVALSLGVAAATNVSLNLALIPAYEEEGAAVAMILTMLVMSGLLLPATFGVTGRMSILRVAAAPVAGCVAMVAVGLALGGAPVTAFPALIAFVAVLTAVERRLYPADADVALLALRRRPAIE